MIISDGYFIKLLTAYNMEEYDNKIDANISLNNREKKNIKYFKEIIKLLNSSGIPFIIFFMPNDLKNQLDDFLIEQIKGKHMESK